VKGDAGLPGPAGDPVSIICHNKLIFIHLKNVQGIGHTAVGQLEVQCPHG